jgi:hypothetical protein
MQRRAEATAMVEKAAVAWEAKVTVAQEVAGKAAVAWEAEATEMGVKVAVAWIRG